MLAARNPASQPLDDGENRVMNSYLVYRASFYLMLFVATMALSGDSPEGQFARLLGLVVAVAGAVAFFTVDRNADAGCCRGNWPISWPSARWACSTSNTGSTSTQRIPALAHWLVYLQLIKYFLPKTAEDDWFLFLLGLMQVLIGSVVNQSDQVGTWLFLWAMLAVWVLGQFFLAARGPSILRASVIRAGPGQRASREFAARRSIPTGACSISPTSLRRPASW